MSEFLSNRTGCTATCVPKRGTKVSRDGAQVVLKLHQEKQHLALPPIAWSNRRTIDLSGERMQIQPRFGRQLRGQGRNCVLAVHNLARRHLANWLFQLGDWAGCSDQDVQLHFRVDRPVDARNPWRHPKLGVHPALHQPFYGVPGKVNRKSNSWPFFCLWKRLHNKDSYWARGRS